MLYNCSELALALVVVAGMAENATTRPLRIQEKATVAVHREFATLDAYLVWLEEQGKSDRPWYRRLPDGRYELMTGRAQRGRRGEIFTREQLMEKYGFDR